jgi:hypothetical protein
MIRQAGLTLWQCTALTYRLPGEYFEKMVKFQRDLIKLRKQYMHMLGHKRNADETLVYSDMLSNVTMEKTGTKSVLIRGAGNEKAKNDSHV